MVHQSSASQTSGKMYATGIVMMSVFGLGHVVFAFILFQQINEPALWFFSAALTMLFGTAINFIHLKVSDPAIFTITVISNILLSAFSIVLALVIKEAQTIALSCVMIYVTCMSVKTKRA